MYENKYNIKKLDGNSVDCNEIELMDGGTLLKCTFSSDYVEEIDQIIDTGSIFPINTIHRIDYVEYFNVEDDDDEDDDSGEVEMSAE